MRRAAEAQFPKGIQLGQVQTKLYFRVLKTHIYFFKLDVYNLGMAKLFSWRWHIHGLGYDFSWKVPSVQMPVTSNSRIW